VIFAPHKKNHYFGEETLKNALKGLHVCIGLSNFRFLYCFSENRVIQFKTAYYGTMALLSDTHINMPFQSWELRPRGMNHAQLSVIAAINECEIEIKVK
jgi:hypothetical protein